MGDGSEPVGPATACGLARIISGGQTGADQAGLETAGRLGIPTGGTMPRGFRTEAGRRRDLARRYGMAEHSSPAYPPRTEANVLAADGTVIFGDAGTGGSLLTAQLCQRHGKPWLGIPMTKPVETAAERLRRWLDEHEVRVLNVAGNRESTTPGITAFTAAVLERALARDIPQGAPDDAATRPGAG